MRALALMYARNNVVIFPCREADSKRGAAKAPYNEGGMHSSTTYDQQINIWWQKWPTAVIGLPCNANGIIGIDADRHGQDDGVSALADHFLICDFNPNSVPNVRTPRDGRHYLFRRPDALGDTKARIGPAIDIRDNAYIIAAGSVMANGLQYTLLNGSVEQLAVAISHDTLPELPSWLSKMAGKPVAPPQRIAGRTNVADQNSEASRQRLKGLVRTAALASPGERNAKLHWAACRAGELIQAGLITEEAAFALFAEAGAYAGLLAREINATVRSGLSKGRGSARYGR
jgi:Bifunctional DNA primase/polymerase, N-terminal